MRSFSISAIALLLAATLTSSTASAQTGVLLLAHGGSETWNQNVRDIASRADRDMPTEVAFGMATRAEIQNAIDRLVGRGVTNVVAVPLFVSSYSTVIDSTEYLLGLRKDMPADLRVFAAMSHGAGAHAGHAIPAEDGTKPVSLRVPVRMSPALNAHPVVAHILRARTAAISRQPSREAVILVAHGPSDDATNARWLKDLRVTASRVKADGYISVDAITVRDDAPPSIRDQAAAELRAIVQHRSTDGVRVLVVPALLSFGGIEGGIRKRLDGLAYEMSTAALAPDERLAAWVLQMAKVR